MSYLKATCPFCGLEVKDLFYPMEWLQIITFVVIVIKFLRLFNLL